MEDILQMDVFFFVTTIFVIIVTVAFIVLSIYIIKIIRDVRKITEDTKNIVENIRGGSKRVMEDIDEARVHSRKSIIKASGRAAGILSGLLAILKTKKKRKK